MHPRLRQELVKRFQTITNFDEKEEKEPKKRSYYEQKILVPDLESIKFVVPIIEEVPIQEKKRSTFHSINTAPTKET